MDYYLHVTINYPENETDLECNFDNQLDMLAYIRSTIDNEPKATSFVFEVVR